MRDGEKERRGKGDKRKKQDGAAHTTRHKENKESKRTRENERRKKRGQR